MRTAASMIPNAQPSSLHGLHSKCLGGFSNSYLHEGVLVIKCKDARVCGTGRAGKQARINFFNFFFRGRYLVYDIRPGIAEWQSKQFHVPMWTLSCL